MLWPVVVRGSGDVGVRLTVSLSYLHSHGPLPKNITPTSPALRRDHGINAPAIIVPPTSFSPYSDRYANPSVRINTHQMSKRVRWEGHNQQTANGTWCFFRQMDKQSARQTTD